MHPLDSNRVLPPEIAEAIVHGDIDEAVVHALQALQGCSTVGNQGTLITELSALQFPEFATKLLEKIENSLSTAPDLFEPLAYLCVSAKQHEKALSFVQRAVQMQRTTPQLLILSAHALSELGVVDQAREILKSLLESVPVPEARQALYQLDKRTAGIQAKPVDSRLILFVSESPKARLMKMAHVLRQYDWRVVLLSRVPPDFETKGLFEEVIQYNNSEHALYCASIFRPRAVHLFSPMADDVSVAFVREKPAPIIFDAYDFIEGMIVAKDFEETRPKQRYCLENADALTCRDLRVRYLAKACNYRLPEKKIFFTEYCWNPAIDLSLKPRPQDGIHVVVCGYIATSRHSHEQDWGYLDVGKLLISQGVHYHVYPHPMQLRDPHFEAHFQDYITLGRENPYFHFHPPVPMDQMTPELAKYHIGVNISMPKLFQVPMLSYTDAHLRYCSSARNMEYLDAGLAVLSQHEIAFQFHMLKRYGLALDTNQELLGSGKTQLENFLSNNTLMQRIAHARKIYSLHAHAPRLMQFYESVQ